MRAPGPALTHWWTPCGRFYHGRSQTRRTERISRPTPGTPTLNSTGTRVSRRGQRPAHRPAREHALGKAGRGQGHRLRGGPGSLPDGLENCKQTRNPFQARPARIPVVSTWERTWKKTEKSIPPTLHWQRGSRPLVREPGRGTPSAYKLWSRGIYFPHQLKSSSF